MATLPTPAPTPPVTEDDFLADRHRFWTSFTGFTTFAAAGIVLILLGLLVFVV